MPAASTPLAQNSKLSPAKGAPLRRRAPVLVAAAVTTAWAAIVSYAPVLAVVWLATAMSGGRVPVPDVLRSAAAGWLLAGGVPLHTPGGPLGLVPLAVSALAGWRVYRAGVHTARAIGARSPGRGAAGRGAAGRGAAGRGAAWRALLAAVCVAGVYGGLGALAAAVTRQPALWAAPLRAGLTFAGVGLLLAGAGSAVESRVAARAGDRLPAVLRDAARTGLVAALLVLGAGAATAGGSVAVAGRDAAEMLAAYHTGVAGQAGLTGLCLAYVPNLTAWAAAYLVGPGFAVGVGTTVSAGHVSLGALPAVPVLVGLPGTAAGGPGALLLGIPVAAGMVAGGLLVRHRLVRHRRRPRVSPAGRVAAGPQEPVARTPLDRTQDRKQDRAQEMPGWLEVLGAAALAGPVAGGLLGLAGWISGGPLGNGRLAQTGPVGWQVALVGAVVVTLGALIGSAASHALIGARRR
jgi:hypothetical protein